MAGELLPMLARAADTNNNVYPGAKWRFYASGGLTPQAVFSDGDLNTSLGAVVTADGGGWFEAIYFDPALSYRGILKDADGVVTIADIDPINTGILASLGGDDGAASVGYKRDVSGSVKRTAAEIFADAPYKLEDFGGGVNETAATNDAAWAILKTLIGTLSETKSIIQFMEGTYQTALGFDLPTVGHQTILEGYGMGRTTIQCTDPDAHVISLNSVGSPPHTVQIRNMTLDGSAEAAGSGNGLHYGGTTDFYSLNLEAVGFDNIANDGIHIPHGEAFTFKAKNCDFNHIWGHGVYGGGNTWSLDSCYVHNIMTAYKAAYRITGGSVIFTNCNGIDNIVATANVQWADIGMTTIAADTPDGVADSTPSFCFATFEGCNIEDFSGTGIHVRNGGLNILHTAFNAPETGTVKAINGRFTNSQGGWSDRHPGLYMGTKGASWANSVAIHSRDSIPPFAMAFVNTTNDDQYYSYYNEAAGSAFTKGVFRSFVAATGRQGFETRDLSITGVFKTAYNGTATLAAGTANVSFGTAMPSATYRILLTGDAAETFRWSSKATGGFTITSSNAGSTANVDWFVVGLG